MANNGDRNGVKFIWKVVNFSCIETGILQSPSFSWKSTEWDVKIHLTDATIGSDSLYISVELHLIKFKAFTAYCSFAFLDSQDFPLVWKEKGFSSYYLKNMPVIDSWNFHNFIKKEEMFGTRRNEFLPNDILTVQCHIWVNPSNYLFIEDVPLIAHTQIEPLLKVTNKSFLWDVANVMSFKRNQVLERVEPLTIDGKPSEIKLLLVFDGEFKVRITVSLFRIHLKVTISVLDTLGGRKHQLVKEEFPFERNGQEFKLGTTLTHNMIKCYRNTFVFNDTLLLHFSFTLSGKVTFNSLVEEDEMVNIVLPKIDASHISEPNESAEDSENDTSNSSDHSDTVSKAVQGLYEEEFLSDFYLKVGDRSFPVHKAILGMRSPVFRAMFTAEMKEKEDNCSVIEDVEADTLQRMLRFVYSDKVEEDMGWERASSLYEAADKYALETLKQKCSAFLRTGLCAESVLHVLKLADMHQDEELKSAAFEFISLNDKETIGSERWNRFEEENNKLASDTFRSLYLHFKKMIR